MPHARLAPRRDPAPDAADLLAWYDRHRRTLPWRAAPGQRPDPYRVWLSEIMLQQTTVAAVIGYFERFLARFPDLKSLAEASLDEVLHAWQGLGYYARARNLHACARQVMALEGGFPADAATLKTLPGIGDYTAAAIAAIAFDRPEAAVDGNVERVMARLYAIETPLPSAKAELRALARAHVPQARAGDYVQAVMDLGATICVPQAPKCILCPWREPCRARRQGIAGRLPVRLDAKAKPVRYGVAFWTVRRDGAVLLRRRPETGLLGGMMEVPSSEWRPRPWREDEALGAAPVAARWRRIPDLVRHTFTHFHLELAVLEGRVRSGRGGEGVWVPLARLEDHALPSVMKKVIAHATNGRAR